MHAGEVFLFFWPYKSNGQLFSPPKAGSTTLDTFLVKNFVHIDNGTTGINWASKAHFSHRYPLRSFSQVNKLKLVKFMITRDPLDRLVSCWYDKFSGFKEHEENAINVIYFHSCLSALVSSISLCLLANRKNGARLSFTKFLTKISSLP